MVAVLQALMQQRLVRGNTDFTSHSLSTLSTASETLIALSTATILTSRFDIIRLYGLERAADFDRVDGAIN